MTLYDDLQTVVRDVLSEFNQGQILYGTVTSGAGAADEPGQSIIDYVALSGAVARGVQTKYVQAGLAVASDLQVTTMVQSGIVPAQKDFVKVDGIQYKVQEIVKKPAAGTVVAYTLILRR